MAYVRKMELQARLLPLEAQLKKAQQDIDKLTKQLEKIALSKRKMELPPEVNNGNNAGFDPSFCGPDLGDFMPAISAMDGAVIGRPVDSAYAV